MPSQYRETTEFVKGFKLGLHINSVGQNNTSAIGIATSNVFSVTNSGTADYTISGTESTAANIAAVLVTVIRRLGEKGLLDVTVTS